MREDENGHREAPTPALLGNEMNARRNVGLDAGPEAQVKIEDRSSELPIDGRGVYGFAQGAREQETAHIMQYVVEKRGQARDR